MKYKNSSDLLVRFVCISKKKIYLIFKIKLWFSNNNRRNILVKTWRNGKIFFGEITRSSVLGQLIYPRWYGPYIWLNEAHWTRVHQWPSNKHLISESYSNWILVPNPSLTKTWNFRSKIMLIFEIFCLLIASSDYIQPKFNRPVRITDFLYP